jgi:hypothetical protein
MPKVDPMRPPYMGRFSSGTIWAIIVVAPEKMPADPIPAMALPTMKLVELGAAPHRADPTSKKKMATRKRFLVE